MRTVVLVVGLVGLSFQSAGIALAAAADSPPLGSPMPNIRAIPLQRMSPVMRHIALQARPVPVPEAPTPAAPADPTAAQAPAPLSQETMATAPKPPGFRYSVIQEGIVDGISGTLLYVKQNKESRSSIAVPIPQDRALLAQCLQGGTVDDLVKGTVITAKYDARGVVRPDLQIVHAAAMEVLDGAKVLDRGPNRLYVITADGANRGFELQGEGEAAWEGVITNGKVDDLLPGAKVKVQYDPSGRSPLQVTLIEKVAQPKDKGCGCQIAATPRPTAGAWLLLAGLGGLLWRRRWA